MILCGTALPAAAQSPDPDLVFFHDFEHVTGDVITAAAGPDALKSSGIFADTAAPAPCSGQHLTTPVPIGFVTVDTNTRLTTSTTALSFSLRYNARGNAGGRERLLSSFDGTGSLPAGQLVFDNLSDGRLRLVGAGGGLAISDGAIPEDEAWHQVGFTFDNGTVRFYLDGAPFGADRSFGVASIAAQTYDWHLIEDVFPVSYVLEYYANGSYDDFGLWTRVLSDAEMAAGPSIDRDGDGLTDLQECALGTDASLPDSDGDGLLDGTEVLIAEGGSCPDPLSIDSDGDGLSDGDEVLVLLTNPCLADTDGDTIPDDIDPLPLDPGGTPGWIESALRFECVTVAGLDVVSFAGKNDNARAGRRNAMCNKLNAAAKAIAQGDLEGATDKLESLLAKLDGEPSPQDWMVDSPERTVLVDELVLLVELIDYL